MNFNENKYWIHIVEGARKKHRSNKKSVASSEESEDSDVSGNEKTIHKV